jgi:NAD(P)-dependent dehydrogenase (short-subunit alcohol dehydrogenase family)
MPAERRWGPRVRTCLVTGANSGIGLETARSLAALGHRLVLLCRNRERGEAARDAILALPGGQAELVIGDLSSMQGIRTAASEIKSRFGRLHVLVNNAGIFRSERELSPDGYELTFAVNHLAYFLLTRELLGLLEQSAEPGRAARIVNVASRAHRYGRLDFGDLMSGRGYSGSRVYGGSKLANILFTSELSRRLEGRNITANCLHPGVVRTGFAHGQGGLSGFFFRRLRWIMLSPEAGASTSVYLATSPEVEGVSGGYFSKCRQRKPSRRARSTEDARRLWECSEALVDRTHGA